MVVRKSQDVEVRGKAARSGARAPPRQTPFDPSEQLARVHSPRPPKMLPGAWKVRIVSYIHARLTERSRDPTVPGWILLTHFTDGKLRPEKQAWSAQDRRAVGHNSRLKRPDYTVSQGLDLVCLGHNSIPITPGKWQVLDKHMLQEYITSLQLLSAFTNKSLTRSHDYLSSQE